MLIHLVSGNQSWLSFQKLWTDSVRAMCHCCTITESCAKSHMARVRLAFVFPKQLFKKVCQIWHIIFSLSPLLTLNRPLLNLFNVWLYLVPFWPLWTGSGTFVGCRSQLRFVTDMLAVRHHARTPSAPPLTVWLWVIRLSGSAAC